MSAEERGAPPTHAELIERASALVRPVILSRPDLDAATVGCALLAQNGRVYEGVCVDLSCGLGFCAEPAAIANMLKDGETRIATIVACAEDRVLPPCGRCRETMLQVDVANLDCEVLLGGGRVVRLRELLPDPWLTPDRS